MGGVTVRCGCERCGCGRCGYGGVAVGGVTGRCGCGRCYLYEGVVCAADHYGTMTWFLSW